MRPKLVHYGNHDLLPEIIFGFPCNNLLNMNVLSHSKPVNLVSYAIKNANKSSIENIIWWSKHGAVAKTIACAESFKQQWSQCQSSSSSNSDDLHPVSDLQQINEIYLQSCECSVPNTDVTCTVEEPTIAILFSKSPIPGMENRIQFQNAVNFSSVSEIDGVPIPSRHRFESYRKTKRDITVDVHGNPNSRDCSVDQCSELKDTLLNCVPYQSPRLAPALSNVIKIFGKKSKKKAKRQMNNKKL